MRKHAKQLRRMICSVTLLVVIVMSGFAEEISVDRYYLPVSPITGRRAFTNAHAVRYATSGELLLASGEGQSAFVLDGDDWKPIITDFETWTNEEIREVTENARTAPRWPPPDTFAPGMYSSKARSNEYLFVLTRGYGGEDYQRFFVVGNGEILVEPITEEYFERNRVYGWPPIQQDLANGYRIELDPDKDENLMARLRILDKDGETVFRITDGVDGIVYGGAGAGTVAVHPDGHQVAILRTRQFEAEDSELYPPRSRITELVLVTLPAEGADCTGGND